MTLRLYNTLTRRKEDFVPREAGRVTMYVCGPTVYNRAHIGNARPAVVFDVLRRLLRHTYPERQVVYARNITDIDDKIIAKAEAEGVPIGEVTARYADFYRTDMGALGVEAPDFEPHATAFVEGPSGMIAMIGELVARGVAYAAQGHVLFDVAAFPDYGSLSRRRLDEMIAGARVEVAPYKRGAADFVLWKPSADDQPGWDSPWGRGRPGWHIECSAMIRAVLGETIDIHGGGLDLIFPHHENELAQSACANHGAPLAQVWMHNGFLSMGAEKMSKSLGNVALIDALLDQGIKPEVLRMTLLIGHYRQPLEWTSRLIEQAENTLDKFYYMLRADGERDAADLPHPSIVEALSDDLNTPKAIAALYELDRQDASLSVIKASAALLGILQTAPDKYFQYVVHNPTRSDRIDDLVSARTAARARKDFAESDRIRDELAAQGIVLEDGPQGTSWRRG